jgi:hypothetical protein
MAVHIEKYVTFFCRIQKDLYGGCTKSVFSFRLDGPLKFVMGVAHKLNGYLRRRRRR